MIPSAFLQVSSKLLMELIDLFEHVLGAVFELIELFVGWLLVLKKCITPSVWNIESHKYFLFSALHP